MKRIMKKTIFAIAAALTLGGCTEFLDRNPSSGLDDATLFADYVTAQAYLDRALQILDRQFDIDFVCNNRSHSSQMSDECTNTGNLGTDQKSQYRSTFFNAGNWLLPRKNSDEWELGVSNGANTILSRAATALRVCNKTLEMADKIGDITEEERNWLKGQAHMLRAWWYFEYLKRYGGMPIMDHTFTSKEDADRPRETYQGSHDWMVQDIEKAIELLPDEWDDPNGGRPNKIAAMAFREMAELYAASPLMQNGLESTTPQEYNKDRAAKAAQLAQDVLDYIAAHSDKYRLLEGTSDEEFSRKNIYWWPQSYHALNPEHLWYNRSQHNLGGTGGMRTFHLTPSGTSTQNGANGAWVPCPTLNMINLFDKKGADGVYYPIEDSRAGYTLENPYADRDPRFYQFIMYPGSEPYGQYAVAANFGTYSAKKDSPFYATTYVGGYDYNIFATNQFTSIKSQQQTSFYHRKFHWPLATENGGSMRNSAYFHRTVFIRVAQIYLDYAEASFEATGSATAKVEGCNMSAEEAINVLRKRWDLTPLASDIVSDPVKFREAYRRERAVELFMEGHRWFDIRRWMIAYELFNPTGAIYGVPEEYAAQGTAPIWGMRTELKPGVEIKTGADMKWDSFTYTPYPMTNVVRVFENKHYWYPFPSLEVASQSKLVQNPGW